MFASKHNDTKEDLVLFPLTNKKGGKSNKHAHDTFDKLDKHTHNKLDKHTHNKHSKHGKHDTRGKQDKHELFPTGKKTKSLGGGMNDEGEVSDEKNALVVRNDDGPTHVFRQYHVVSAPDGCVVLHKLSSSRYVVSNSAVVLAQSSDPRVSPQEIDVSLDGPVYKPIDSDVVTYIGKYVKVRTIDNEDVLGIVLQFPSEAFVDLYVPLTKHNVRTKYIQIQDMTDLTISPIWNQQLQNLVVSLPSNSIETLYLHYQLKERLFTWKPSYRATIHPSFQYLISLRCIGIVTNNSEESMHVDKLHLRVMRNDTRSNDNMNESLPRYPQARMMLMQSAPSDTNDSTTVDNQLMQEFVTHLPNHTLPAKRSCRVPLFQMTRIPISSWYEVDVDASIESTDVLHLPLLYPRWYLKIDNGSDNADGLVETSVMTLKKMQSHKQQQPPVNWPAGNIQLIVLGDIQSLVIQPEKLNWLQNTWLNAVPKGESGVLRLPDSWQVSVRAKVTLVRTNVQQPPLLDQETTKQEVDVRSLCHIQISNTDSKSATRFPLRIRVNVGQHTNINAPTEPTWLTKTQNIPYKWTAEGMYWVFEFASLPPSFKQVFQVEIAWTETERVSIRKSIRRGGANANGSGNANEVYNNNTTELDVDDDDAQLSLLVPPTDKFLPVPVPRMDS